MQRTDASLYDTPAGPTKLHVLALLPESSGPPPPGFLPKPLYTLRIRKGFQVNLTVCTRPAEPHASASDAHLHNPSPCQMLGAMSLAEAHAPAAPSTASQFGGDGERLVWHQCSFWVKGMKSPPVGLV